MFTPCGEDFYAYGEDFYASAPLAGKISTLTGKISTPADRFRIETADGVHRIYDDLSRHPLGGKPDPLVDALSRVAEQDRERVQRDRATVADQGLSMPARLAALARLQRRAQR